MTAAKTNPIQGEILPATSVGSKHADDLYAVTLHLKKNKIELDSYGIQGRTKYGHLFSKRKVRFVPDDEKLPSIHATLAASPEEITAFWASRKRKWLFRSFAGLLWITYTSYLVLGHGLLGALLDLAFGSAAAAWESWLLVAIIAALLVVSCFYGGTRVLLTGLYIAFFPFVLAGLLVWHAALRIPTKAVLKGAYFGNRAAVVVLDPKFFTAACVIIGLNLTAIQRTTSEWVAVISIPVLVLLLLYFILVNFYWVARLGSGLTKTTNRMLDELDSSLDQSKTKLTDLCISYRRANRNTPESEAAKKAILLQLKSLLPIHADTQTLELVNNYVPMRAIVLFLFGVRFVVSLCAVLLIYAAMYTAIDRLSHRAFVPGTLNSTINAIYFSAATFTLNAHEEASSSVAKWVVLSQVFCGMIMFTGLVLSFSTISVEVADSQQHRLRSRVSDYLQKSEAIICEHFDPGNLSIKQMAVSLEREFDRFFRWENTEPEAACSEVSQDS